MSTPTNTPTLPNSGISGITGAPGAPAAPGALDALGDKLPYDIRELIPYTGYWIDWLLGALLAVILIALVIWLYKRYQRYRRGPNTKDAPPPKTLMELLNDLSNELMKLSPSSPFDRKAQKEYFFKLSLLFRQFIELRFKFPATDQTFQEIRKPLKQYVSLPSDELNDVLKFLERSDLIKFAGEESDLTEAKTWHEKALSWMKQLMPRNLDVGGVS